MTIRKIFFQLVWSQNILCFFVVLLLCVVVCCCCRWCGGGGVGGGVERRIKMEWKIIGILGYWDRRLEEEEEEEEEDQQEGKILIGHLKQESG